MLGAFLDQITGLFDRRFLLAYWAPLFVVLGLATLGAAAIQPGVAPALAVWAALDPLLQLILPLAGLLAITVLAYILQAMTAPLMRLYEGYWPGRLDLLARWAIDEQRERRAELLAGADFGSREAALRGLYQAGAYRDLSFGYPRSTRLVRPTRLGNVLTAAEEYPYQVYRLDTILWWPRLAPLLPEALRAQLDGALTPLIALINLSFLSALLALAGGPFLVVIDRSAADQPMWLFLAVLLGGLLVARLCYEAAIVQASDYGSLLRVAFDLHRHKILEEMHIARPTGLVQERRLWDALNQWVYRYIPPWESHWPPDPATPPADDFHYDTYKPPPSPEPETPRQFDVTLRVAPPPARREEATGE